MTITTNLSGTRTIEITEQHLETIKKYKLFSNLIDSNGIIDAAPEHQGFIRDRRHRQPRHYELVF